MRLNRQRDDGVIAAIEAVGSISELSRRLGISAQSISDWKRVPSVRVLQIEQIADVPRHVLRPDLYPLPPVRKSSRKAAKGFNAQRQLQLVAE